jgi:hypothetical protein
MTRDSLPRFLASVTAPAAAAFSPKFEKVESSRGPNVTSPEKTL